MLRDKHTCGISMSLASSLMALDLKQHTWAQEKERVLELGSISFKLSLGAVDVGCCSDEEMRFLCSLKILFNFSHSYMDIFSIRPPPERIENNTCKFPHLEILRILNLKVLLQKLSPYTLDIVYL